MTSHFGLMAAKTNARRFLQPNLQTRPICQFIKKQSFTSPFLPYRNYTSKSEKPLAEKQPEILPKDEQSSSKLEKSSQEKENLTENFRKSAKEETEPSKDVPVSIVERVKIFIRENGRYGIVTYAGVCATVFLSILFSIKTFLDVNTVLYYFGMEDNELLKNGGPVALAFFIYKVAMPVRFSLALFLTPRLKPILSKFF